MKVTKNRKTIRKIVDECSVVYDNGVWCEYEKTNYKLTKVQFFSPTEKRLYYLDNTAKEKLSNIHWNEHYLIIKEHQIKITEKEIPAVFLSGKDKVEQFQKEFKLLLAKYDAEIEIQDFGRNWSTDEKIVVTFAWDKELSDKVNDGIVPDWVVGRWENGR
jgi:hypothetical protein